MQQPKQHSQDGVFVWLVGQLGSDFLSGPLSFI